MAGKLRMRLPIQGIPVVSLVAAKYPISWSDDNNVILLTSYAAYVFELQISPHNENLCINFDKKEILPPNEPHPFILKGKELINLVSKLSREDADNIMLDITLTAPHRAYLGISEARANKQKSNLVEDSLHLRFSRAAWSSLMIDGGSYLLCLLTYDHQMQIFEQIDDFWERTVDLTSIWYHYSKSDGQRLLQDYTKTIGHEAHHLFISETQFLAISEIAWSHSMILPDTDYPCCFLFLATASLHIALVKFVKSSTEKDSSIISFCFALQNSLEKCTALKWSALEKRRGVLIIGTLIGSIALYLISFDGSNIVCRELIVISSNFGRVAVNLIEIIALPSERNLFLIFATQHSKLVSFLVEGTDIYEGHNPNFNVVSSNHVSLGTFGISGLNVDDASHVNVCLKDGKLFEVEVNIQEDSSTSATHITLNPIATPFSSDGVYYNGFSFSPNNSFVAIAESVALPYDHLKLKEPVMINFFQVLTIENIINQIFSGEIERLCDYIDIFEALRISLYRDKTLQLPILSTSEFSDLPKHLKRVHLWVSTMIAGSSASKNQEFEERMEKYLIIFLSEHISQLVNESVVELSSRDEAKFQDNLYWLSLKQMSILLKQNDTKSYTLELLEDALKGIEVVEETCLVCSSPVEFKSVRKAVCLEGHTIPRCLSTLLPTAPSLKCVYCQLFYHSSPYFRINGEMKCLICSKSLKKRKTRSK